jgi:myo-inositol catabolism protein IolH
LKKAMRNASVPDRVKLAVDPTMIRHLPVPEVLRVVAEVGFEHVELSPRLDFLPPSRGRRASRDATAQIASAARDSGVGIASLFVVYPWATPDEERRAAAVRYLAQACEVAVELGCERLNTEPTGDPRRPLESEFDDVMTVTVFAWEDRAIDSFRANLEAVRRHLAAAAA